MLPTYSNNLAGSASVTAQYYIGQGCSFLGYTRDQDNSWFKFSRSQLRGARLFITRRLMNQYGGYVQGQYWFTNEWFVNAAWGFNRNYGVSEHDWSANPAGSYASNNDQTKLWQEDDLTLFYRPIASLKFGLTYAFESTYYLQKLNNPTLGGVGQRRRAESAQQWCHRTWANPTASSSPPTGSSKLIV